MAQTYTQYARRSASRLFIGAVAVLASLGPSAAQATDLQLVYLANFHNGSLDASVDRLGVGALQKGDSQVPNSDPTWNKVGGALEIGIKPPPGVTDTVSAGVWATPVKFDKGSIFALRATFVRPTGPHDPTDIWAVALSARTGGAPDLGTATRTGVTFQVRGDGARMNAQGLVTPLGLKNLEPAIYNRIFSSAGPQKFTLELLVNRLTGKGTATLTVGSFVLSKPLEFKDFTATSGDPITSVGAAIAIASGSGKQASVQLREFRILAPK